MSKIHISRNRQALGHFLPEEVAVGLRTGRFFPTDLAWRDPMETWKPLAEFTDLPVGEIPPDLPPDLPVAVPADETGPAWEQTGPQGFFARLAGTVGQMFSRPGVTMRGLRPDVPTGRALGYYLLLATFSSWISLGYNLAVVLLFPEALAKSPFAGTVTKEMMVSGSILNMVMAPFFLAGVAFVVAGILHLLLGVLGVAQAAFSRTLRVYCYAVGTAFLFLLIPGCGTLLLLPWAVGLLAAGLKEAHGTDLVRSSVAVILPAIVLVLLYGMLFLAMQSGAVK